MNRPEVLAPVGDQERLIAAIQYGADAVYLGGKEFGMRAAPANFDREQLRQAVEYAHSKGVRVYLTCNTLPRNEEIERFPEYIQYVDSIGVDACIVSDIGVFAMVREYAPNMELHVSTQAGIVNYQTANAFYQMGAKRVVLARELSLEEIREIRQRTPEDLELEVFVHGAMCMSFSGRCLLSNYLADRDANRGECAQPCRWNYYLMEEKRPGQYFPVFEDEKGSYILNAKDMCMIEYIDQLIEAGVTSLKIEGRAKSAYYVSVITNAYRCAMDQYLADPEHFKLEPWIRDEVYKVSHRRYSTGFYFGTPDQYYENGGYLREYDVVAVVDGWENGRLICTQKNKFSQGEEIELLAPQTKPITLTVEDLQDGEGTGIESACHPHMKVSFLCDTPLEPGAVVRRGKLTESVFQEPFVCGD
ncbi:MAG: peptidase U32 family protein [Massiliimalia sp.]